MLRYSATHDTILRNTSPNEQRFVLVRTDIGEDGKQDASIGIYMKTIVSAFLVAFYTNRALLVRDQGDLPFSALFMQPCFEWRYDIVMRDGLIREPTMQNTFNFSIYGQSDPATAWLWNENHQLLNEGNIERAAGGVTYLLSDLSIFVLPLLAVNPHYADMIQADWDHRANDHMHKLLFRVKPQVTVHHKPALSLCESHVQSWVDQEIRAFLALHYRPKMIGVHVVIRKTSHHVLH